MKMLEALFIDRLYRCCNNPDIHLVESNICNDRRICCFNCKEIVVVSRHFYGYGELVMDWNNMIIERDRKKREIVKVEVDKYPFVFAMI